jgi:predicted MPP superfamily phosphohydrolase
MIRLVIAIFVFLLIEIYSFLAFRTIFRSKWVAIGYEIVNILIILFIIWSVMHFDRHTGQNKLSLFTAGLLLVTLLPKIVLGLFMFGEDLFRVPMAISHYFSHPGTVKGHFPERRKFVSQMAFGLAAVPFLGLLHGIFIGKYNFRVIKQTLAFDDLPDAFDGFRITQISDVHSGSFDNPEKIQYAIDLINGQNSDLVLFTGDIVNAMATEMHPWIDMFKSIKTPAYGKYSILGNHDYGEYLTWNSAQEKRDNFEAIKDLHRQIDFKLLLNDHTFIEKGSDRIAIIGVENWGVNFKQAGDLAKASSGLTKDDFKILMSHDPSHWESEVKKHPKHFQLTLSGHTHGFQFGIEIPGIIKWSPVQYIYKQWAGLYENLGRYVYVNRGLGFHAYPGRVGIWPEITVIELKKKGSAA